MPNVAGAPFLLAVEAFHAPNMMPHADGSFETLAYGLPGTQAGLFYQDERMQNISGILFSNGATVGLFGRMGAQNGLAEEGVIHVREGSVFAPESETGVQFFRYVAGKAGSPEEEFRDSLRLFHNPRALHPLPYGALPKVTENFVNAEGDTMTKPGRFMVIMSSTSVFTSEERAKFLDR